MSEAAKIVEVFLEALGRRDLDAAQEFLGCGFRMIATGGHVFASLSEFVAFSKDRHKGAKKLIDSYDVIRDGEATIVYAIGSMSGTWNDGTKFDRVRYIDRFEVVYGKIVDMRIWSDLAEFRNKEKVIG